MYRMNSHYLLMCMILLCMNLSACMVGPSYQAPEINSLTPKQWFAAHPSIEKIDASDGFWRQFNDDVLLTLIDEAYRNSTSLAQVMIRIESAHTVIKTGYANLLPSTKINGDITKSRAEQGGLGVIQKAKNGNLSSVLEIDLFGEKRAQVLQAQADLERNQINWHATRNVLSAEIATYYTNLRACEAQQKLQQDSLLSYERTLVRQKNLVKSGFSKNIDLLSIETALAQLKDDVVQQEGQCHLLIKSLVALTNIDEMLLRDMLKPNVGFIAKPGGFMLDAVPAHVISKRPDLAMAERKLAIASYKINEKEAQRYPHLGNPPIFKSI